MLKMKTRKQGNKGFTLVELIIVIAIIAVLSVIAVVAYSNISEQAKQAAITSDASTVIRALNTYNSLAADGKRIEEIEKVTIESLAKLALTEDNGGIEMKLGVSITQGRLDDVYDIIDFDKGTVADPGSMMWFLTDKAEEET